MSTAPQTGGYRDRGRSVGLGLGDGGVGEPGGGGGGGGGQVAGQAVGSAQVLTLVLFPPLQARHLRITNKRSNRFVAEL
jgi:hypothetical protein